MSSPYSAIQPERSQLDALEGAAVLDFGTNWCGHCKASEPVVGQALATRADVRHIKVEDASGRTLGRSYGVKRWPTLVFLRDGQEVVRMVRPLDAAAVRDALDLIVRRSA